MEVVTSRVSSCITRELSTGIVSGCCAARNAGRSRVRIAVNLVAMLNT
jgi:hypothetical protein